jgi:hypothetical protein
MLITTKKWNNSQSEIGAQNSGWAWVIGSQMTDQVKLHLLIDSGGGTTKAEDAQGTPAQSHISPSILVYEDRDLG